MQGLRRAVATAGRRLLRVLLLWQRALSANSGRRRWTAIDGGLLWTSDNVPSSSPRRCGIGSGRSARRRRSSSQARHGRTAIAKASTPSFVTSCSTARSSTASQRLGSSSKAGENTTTPCAPTHRSDTGLRRRQPLCRRQTHHQQWPKSRPCIRLLAGHQMGADCCCPSKTGHVLRG